jgi:hypothetical protein
MFIDQIGKNMEVYVDDMLIKSAKSNNHITDLKGTFQTLRRYEMNLNSTKCAFGVSLGTFFGIHGFPTRDRSKS